MESNKSGERPPFMLWNAQSRIAAIPDSSASGLAACATRPAMLPPLAEAAR